MDALAAALAACTSSGAVDDTTSKRVVDSAKQAAAHYGKQRMEYSSALMLRKVQTAEQARGVSCTTAGTMTADLN